MTCVDISNLWPPIEEVLCDVTDELGRRHSDLYANIKVSTGGTFIVSGSLSLMKAGDLNSDELALSVDVQRSADGIRWTSDICLDDGRIISEGPEKGGMTEADFAECGADLTAQTVAFIRSSVDFLEANLPF